MKKLLIILGPTSTGKTNLALYLARGFNGELISCDSRQVYKGLDIGTGKAPSEMYNVQFTMYKKENHWEINGIKIWMLDVTDPRKQYTVADYVKHAEKVIAEITKRGKLPIVVGGTGLYLKALLEGLPNLEIPIDLKLRKQLNNLTVKQLQKKLQDLDKNRWDGMNNSDKQNPRRLIRAIELAVVKQGKRIKNQESRIKGFDTLKIGLTAQREVLYKRSDIRVINRFEQGMIEEAEKLHGGGLTFKRMKQLGLEYRVLADYLMRKIKDKKELIKILQLKIHGYIRRQLTWFKREKNVFWYDICDNKYLDKVEKQVAKWYHQSYATKN